MPAKKTIIMIGLGFSILTYGILSTLSRSRRRDDKMSKRGMCGEAGSVAQGNSVTEWLAKEWDFKNLPRKETLRPKALAEKALSGKD